MSGNAASGKLNLEEPILRDFMAIERTVMANERTFLSYIRAALGFFIAGASFVEFFDSVLMHWVGYVFAPTGIAVFFVGWLKYRKINRIIQGAEQVIDVHH